MIYKPDQKRHYEVSDHKLILFVMFSQHPKKQISFLLPIQHQIQNKEIEIPVIAKCIFNFGRRLLQGIRKGCPNSTLKCKAELIYHILMVVSHH